MNALQFRVGHTYQTRSICDHNCIVSLTITARTAKTVTGRDPHGKVKTFRPYISDHYKAECLRPWGNYSMSPLLSATDTAELRPPCDMQAYPMDPPGYAARVRQLESEGLTTSDAQGVADMEYRI